MVTNMLYHRYYVTGMYLYYITSLWVFMANTWVISYQQRKSNISVGRFNPSHWLEITIHILSFYYYYKITYHVIIQDHIIIILYNTTKES